jgi:hypothetical protein
MTYRIVWRPPAFDRMREIVLAYPHLVGVFAAALRDLSEALGQDPAHEGESREEDYRVTFYGPLTFVFRPAPAEGKVYVTRVRLRGDP